MGTPQDMVQTVQVDRLFHYARRMALEGRIPLALEALGMSAQCDIAQGINMFDNLDNVSILSEHYRELAEITRQWAQIPPLVEVPPQGKIRLAYIMPNIIDDTNAQTARLRGLVTNHDKDKYEVCVFSTEEFAARPYPLLWINQSLAGSDERAPQTIKHFETLGVKTYLAPVEGTMLDTAWEVSRAITTFRPHVAFYQGSTACPIMCLLAGWRLAPAQVSFNTGVPMYMRGLDLTLFASAYKLAKDMPKWNPAQGGLALIPPAVNEPDETPLRFALPPKGTDDVVMITLSNHPEKRLSDEFVGVMITVLKNNPTAKYWVVGTGNCEKQAKMFTVAGVAKQVLFFGGLNNPWPVLKAADIYVNEFPIGGAQSVMEAMSVGLPVVATVYSGKHQHSCGAGYIGKWAVSPYTPEAYVAKLDGLIKDKEARKLLGGEMLNYVNEHCRYATVTKEYEKVYERLLGVAR